MQKAESFFSKIQTRDNFQALAQAKAGHLAAIMRGCAGDEYFEHGYYIFDGATHVGTMCYRVNLIKRMFESGELKLLKGSIPEKENWPDTEAA